MAENISGIINSYHIVTNISPTNDTLTIADNISYPKGDKMMLVQMTGATLDLLPGLILEDILNTGKFEILVIDQVIGGNKIVFQSEIENTGYDVDEALQLIHIPEYEQAVITGTLTADPWNGRTGGILALIANQSLTMNAGIDVSGLGFRGAEPDSLENYKYGCAVTSSNFNAEDFHDTSTLAAYKGEGFITLSSVYTKGRQANGNGGGGGNAKYFGGGGGCNVITGGLGGYEFEDCGLGSIDLQAKGGDFDIAENEFYTNLGKRITLGGGGGTSNQNVNSNLLATKGGNGGGIVLIMADTLISNNHIINVNGDSVTDVATAGTGGGGGGGAILLAVNNYGDDLLRLHAMGGKGGDMLTRPVAGPGGGGGRGMIWHTYNSLPANINTRIQNNPGERGKVDPLIIGEHGASNGVPSKTGIFPVNGNMILPLNGFLFNKVYTDQAICEGYIPQKLTATYPKGGDGLYTYQWQKSTDKINWTNVGNPIDTTTYQPPALNDTTYYRRYVTSAGISDTSKIITINVHDAITGNVIGDSQLLCSATNPNILRGKQKYDGGNNSTYFFQWEQSSDGSAYTSVPANGQDTIYDPGVLTDSTFYRRKVESGVCTSNSNPLLIAVLKPLQNNNIYQEQDVCYGNAPLPLTGDQPIGGDNTFDITWQQSLNNISWTDAPGTNDQVNYAPGSLTDTIFYRRFITSGPGALCSDSSNVLQINILNPIENNIIFKDDTACQEDRLTLTGSQPTKGAIDQYKYAWESSENQVVWNTEEIFDSNLDFTTGSLIENTYFRRIVASGRNDACINASSSILIRVWNKINGNFIRDDQDICYGVVPDTLNENGTLTGGNGTFNYTWQIRKTSEEYSNIPGAFDNIYSFSSTPDTGIYFIRRKVVSDVCENYSDSLRLIVLPVIKGNNISNTDYTCYNTNPQIFNANSVSGGRGNNDYDYLWQISEDGINFVTAIGGADTEFYQGQSMVQKKYFRRIVSSGNCADTSNIHEIDIVPLPVSNIINTRDTICEKSDLNIEFVLTGKSPWEIVYRNENEERISVSVDESDKRIKINPSSSFTFVTDSVVDDNGCLAVSHTGAAIVDVINHPTTSGGPDSTVCSNTFTLMGDTTYPAYWTYDPDEINLDDIFKPDAIVTVDKFGEKQLFYHMYNWFCETIDTIVITFFEQPVTVDAGEDIIVNFRTDTIFNAVEPLIGKGFWELMKGDTTVVIAEPENPKSKVESLKKGEYYFKWTISNGTCMTIFDSVLIKIDDIKIPQGFSPNGDGVNDAFEIEAVYYLLSKDPEAIISLKVVNRWGQEVYSELNYKNDWDGRHNNGEQLPEGTYFYILELQSVNRVETGFVVIKRD